MFESTYCGRASLVASCLLQTRANRILTLHFGSSLFVNMESLANIVKEHSCATRPLVVVDSYKKYAS